LYELKIIGVKKSEKYYKLNMVREYKPMSSLMFVKYNIVSVNKKLDVVILGAACMQEPTR
jgi:hypothetical protein